MPLALDTLPGLPTNITSRSVRIVAPGLCFLEARESNPFRFLPNAILAYTTCGPWTQLGIPTIVATSVFQVITLGGWSLEESLEVSSVAPSPTSLAMQEPLVGTISALTASDRLLG